MQLLNIYGLFIPYKDFLEKVVFFSLEVGYDLGLESKLGVLPHPGPPQLGRGSRRKEGYSKVQDSRVENWRFRNLEHNSIEKKWIALKGRFMIAPGKVPWLIFGFLQTPCTAARGN
ncbi:hypothetical protein SAMN00777080_4759 [Aquiflexum balticum DSM 16537]|uniref:Uncharacterized protein n=1 Tax=Aquiflexum balticum DSM 16537 TaxID=758820 RepID=A0A1W2HB11_9BACT|nr:hypothetical protein SAMN00777080_4759 [Aquiflexum balticum DSM 16537]